MLLVLAVTAWLSPHPVAYAACTTTICVGGATACTISGTQVLDDDCVLDFGTKDVTIASNGTLTVSSTSHNYSVLAGSLTVRGELEGGSVDVDVDGTFATEVVSNSPGRIDINGGGTFTLVAGGDVTIAGKSCDANATSTTSSGWIDISGDDVLVSTACTANGAGGNDGGSISLLAVNSITVDDQLEADGAGSGAWGGEVVLDAGTTVDVNDFLSVSGGSGGAVGGDIEILAGGAITIDGALTSNGGGAEGDGGSITVEGDSVTTSTVWQANAGSAGGGGAIAIDAIGSFASSSSSDLRVTSSGDGDGGTVDVFAGTTIALEGDVDAHTGGDFASGGDIVISGGGDVSIASTSTVDANTTAGPDSFGGTVTIESSGGDVLVDGQLDAGGAGSFAIGGWIDVSGPAEVDVGGTLTADVGTGGDGDGYIEIAGCVIDVSGTVDTRTPSVGGGENLLTYGGTLTVSGSLLSDDPTGNLATCRCVDADDNQVCDAPLMCETSPVTTGATITPSLSVTPAAIAACL